LQTHKLAENDVKASGGSIMAGEPTPTGAWTITAALFFFMLINFADKTVVGLAAVPIMRELNLTPKEFGLLGSSFFFLFSISGVIVGFLANRVMARWLILGLALSWSLVQFPMIASVGFATLVACRILLGAGEGPAFAVSIHAAYQWFPNEKRTLPTAVIAQGSAFGVIVALPAVNWIIVHYSWHWAFGTLGVVGLLWAVVWLYLGDEGPLANQWAIGRRSDVEPIPYKHLLLTPTFVGCCLACFGAYWALSLGLTWFTPFIVSGLGYSQASAGWLSTLPWVMGATVVLSTGWVSQALMEAGVSSRLARGVLGSAPLVLGGLIVLLVPYAESASWKIALLVIGSGLTGSIYVVCPPMLSEFTPTSQRAAVIAILGAIYTVAGIVAPVVTGTVVQNAPTPLAGYYRGYAITAMVQIAGGLAGLLLLWPASQTAQRPRWSSAGTTT
jgi:MFS family permease